MILGVYSLLVLHRGQEPLNYAGTVFEVLMETVLLALFVWVLARGVRKGTAFLGRNRRP